jgi:hypothetical protein
MIANATVIRTRVWYILSNPFALCCDEGVDLPSCRVAIVDRRERRWMKERYRRTVTRDIVHPLYAAKTA